MKISIDTRLLPSGFTTIINNTHHPVTYPSSIWKAFPEPLRLPFAEFITFMTTVHFAFKNHKINYLFPAPIGEAFYYYGLILSMPENITDFKKTRFKTSDFLRIAVNGFYQISFTGHVRSVEHQTHTYVRKKNVAILPFSLGKDSLLTYVVCKELGIRTIPIFLIEPTNESENRHKLKLIKKFNREFKEDVITFTVPLATLKETKGLWWGWDNFLTQYTMFLIPFMHYARAQYFFWSNERECNEIAQDQEGFLVNATFDQSSRWTQTLNTGLRLFGSNASLGSLVEPLSELAILDLLHRRSPEIGAYQTSCFFDEPNSSKKRWCGKCSECARVYVSLVGLGIDPRKVGFADNMLRLEKRKYHQVFADSGKNDNYLSNKYTYTRNEKLLALYLAFKKGARGKLMEEFKTHFFEGINKKFSFYKKAYFSLADSVTIPKELKQRVYKLYELELKRLRREL